MDIPKMGQEPLFATTLLDLNADCLYKIFDDMIVKDLYSITQTCTRLRDIGREVFQRKHRLCNFELLKIRKIVQVKRVLKMFGPLMVELKIHLGYHSHPHRDIVAAISENCTALESLTLRCYKIPDDKKRIIEVASLFGRLKKLTIEFVFFKHVINSAAYPFTTPNGNWLNFFDGCDSLCHLEVRNCKGLDQIVLGSQFPKLQHFVYTTKHRSSPIADFASQNTNLKTISLDCTTLDHEFDVGADATWKHLERIRFSLESPVNDPIVNDVSVDLEKMQNLRELRICGLRSFARVAETDLLKALPKLSSSLEILSLLGAHNVDGNRELLKSSVSQLENLRSFEFMCPQVVIDIGLVDKLKNLNELSLIAQEARPFDLVQMVRCLGKLTKLIFFLSGFRLSPCTFGQLVNVVNARSQPKYQILNLSCRVLDSLCFLKQSESVKIRRDEVFFRNFGEPFSTPDKDE